MKRPPARLTPLRTLRRSRELRQEQTDAEQKLWSLLRGRRLDGMKFRRQHPIGRFFADFCCIERLLVVELDGGQHAEQEEADPLRSDFLHEQGYRVLRFWDSDVLTNPDGVLEQISAALRAG